jgi:hypothetical protein
MANIAHDIAGLRLDAVARPTWSSTNPTRNFAETESAETEVMTSSRPPSAIDPMFNESLNLSPVRAGVEDKPRIESLDIGVAKTQVLLHYDNGVSLRLGNSHLVNLKDSSRR